MNNFNCTKCEVTCNSRSEMTKHSKTHSNKRQKESFNCIKCGLTFYAKGILMYHQKNKHKDDEKLEEKRDKEECSPVRKASRDNNKDDIKVADPMEVENPEEKEDRNNADSKYNQQTKEDKGTTTDEIKEDVRLLVELDNKNKLIRVRFQ